MLCARPMCGLTQASQVRRVGPACTLELAPGDPAGRPGTARSRRRADRGFAAMSAHRLASLAWEARGAACNSAFIMTTGRPARLRTREERLDAEHLAVAALRAVAKRHARQPLIAVLVVQRRRLLRQHWCWRRQQLAAARQLGRAVPVAQQAVVADALESRRQDMQQEAADEFLPVQAHDLLARVVPVVLPVEADLAIGQVDEAIVGNRHAVRVPPKYSSTCCGPPNGGLA